MLRTLFLALVIVAGGCSKSHDVELDGSGLDGSGPDAGGTGGEGGEGGAGSGGEGGTGGAVPECVVSECDPAPDLPLPIPIDTCCTAQELCGLSTAFIGGGECLERDAPGTMDSSCPSRSMMGLTAAGCCKEDGTCGVMDTFIGFGCIDFMGSGQACGGGQGGSGGAGGGNGGAGGGGGDDCPNDCPPLGFAAGFVGVTECCTSTGQCGGNLQGNCIELDQPGEPSPDCPPVSIMGRQLDGCCRPDGQCGADDGGAIGFGCTVVPGASGTCTPSRPD